MGDSHQLRALSHNCRADKAHTGFGLSNPHLCCQLPGQPCTLLLHPPHVLQDLERLLGSVIIDVMLVQQLLAQLQAGKGGVRKIKQGETLSPQPRDNLSPTRLPRSPLVPSRPPPPTHTPTVLASFW